MSDTSTDASTQSPILAPMANSGALYFILYIAIILILVKWFKIRY